MVRSADRTSLLGALVRAAESAGLLPALEALADADD